MSKYDSKTLLLCQLLCQFLAMSKEVNKTSTEARVEAHVKELVKEVFDRRPIGKIVSDTGSHSVSLGYDKYNKRVRKRLGADFNYANQFKLIWNSYIERNDTFGAQMLTEATGLDVRTAQSKLKNFPSVSLSQCVDFYIAHALPSQGEYLTVEAAIDKYFEFQQSKGLDAVSSDPNHKTPKTYYDPMREKLGSQKLINLTSDKVQKYLVKMSKGWGARTWNNHRNEGVRFWNVLSDKGYCSEALNPWKKIDLKKENNRSTKNSSKKAVKHNVAKEYFEWLEEKCAQYPSMYVDLSFAAMTWFCGIRIEEVTRIGWDDIDRKAEYIDETGEKDFSGWSVTVWDSQEKMEVTKVNPIPENAKHWLELCEKNWPEDELSWIAHPNWYDRKKRIWANWKKHNSSNGLPQNASRHTWSTHHLALYGSEALTKKRLGHHDNSPTLFRYYRAFAKPSEGKEYFNIVPASVDPSVIEERVTEFKLEQLKKDNEAAKERWKLHQKLAAQQKKEILDRRKKSK